jgi:hypothetical protein
MGNVQEAELEIPLCGGFIIGGVLRAARSRRREPGSALPSAIAPMLYARNGDISAVVIVAVAIVVLIRRRAANQFRKGGTVLASQPGFAQKR